MSPDFEQNVYYLLGQIKADVEALKQKDHDHEMREWIKVAVVIPIITLLHAIMNKFGVKV